MIQINFAPQTGAVAYDNQGAYDQLQKMMARGAKLNITFNAKDNVPYAWVESKNVAGFRYELKVASIQGLINYLLRGELADFDPNPSDHLTLQEDDGDFTEAMMRECLKAGFTIQWTPLFRTSNNHITGLLPMKNGTIHFWMKRSEELLDYLRENGQLI